MGLRKWLWVHLRNLSALFACRLIRNAKVNCPRKFGRQLLTSEKRMSSPRTQEWNELLFNRHVSPIRQIASPRGGHREPARIVYMPCPIPVVHLTSPDIRRLYPCYLPGQPYTLP